jgi:hypothetical protein
MKFYLGTISVLSIIIALGAAVIQAWIGQYFRCSLLVLFVVMQCNVLAIRMYLERE